MLASRRSVLCALFVATAACGGTAEPERAENAAPNDGRIDPTSADVVPTGVYTPTVIAASCNVNGSFQRGEPQVVVRRPGTGVNFPLPNDFGDPSAAMSNAPRMEGELTPTMKKWTMTNDVLCPGGSIVASVTLIELGETRVTFRYREEPRDCVYSTCTVDYLLDLAERACPPTTDPSCVPGEKSFSPRPGANLDVECECASP